MQISLRELIVISELFKSTPLRTPNRNNVILENAKSILSDRDEEVYPSVTLNINVDISMFQLTIHCIDAIQFFIPQIKETLCKERHYPLCQIYVLPINSWCCGKNAKIQSYGAEIILYDIDFISKVKSYHGKCGKCKANYYYGFKETGGNARTFDLTGCDFLMFTSGTAFSLRLLRFVDAQITVGKSSFEKLCSVYNTATQEVVFPLRGPGGVDDPGKVEIEFTVVPDRGECQLPDTFYQIKKYCS